MEVDGQSDPPQSQSQKIEALIGPLSSSLAKLSGSSRGFPSDKDFHFYNNFDEFSLPISQISNNSEQLLSRIGSANPLWGKEVIFPRDNDEEAYDYLVNINDEVFERFDASLDELKQGGEGGGEGFQVVYGKNKKRSESEGDLMKNARVTAASRVWGKATRVPFHIPTIPRPQDEYKIVVNNANQPFQHVWLERGGDGEKLVHPLVS